MGLFWQSANHCRGQAILLAAIFALAVPPSQDLLAVAFPSENELYAKLHQGMTAHEVVSTFGSPLHKKSERNGSLTMFYHASANQLLDEREGYAGFEIQLVNGRVTGWRILREQPSFRPNTQTPPRWIFLFYGAGVFILLACVRLVRCLGRATARRGILETYRLRDLGTEKLPMEFRFITHAMTLRDVINRLGEPSRLLQLPVDPASPPGFSFITTAAGQQAIVVAEYQLPYHAPVYIMPEFPFDTTSRIRGIFQGELEIEILQER